MSFRIALAQINVTVGDFAGNARKIIEGINRARAAGADLVAFPELALCGYPPEDLLFRPAFLKENLRYLKQILPATQRLSVILGLSDGKDDKFYNAAAFIHNGKLVDIYHKILLPNYGVFDEKRYFQPGTHCPIFQLGGVTIGVNICEDIWHRHGPARTQARLGHANLIVNISASPYHELKLTERERMLRDRVRENGAYLAYVNLVGGQDELVFDGGSMVLNPQGRLIARAPEFAEDFLLVEINPKISPPRSLEKTGCRIIKIHSLKTAARPKNRSTVKAKVSSKLPVAEEIYRALVLGTWDYFHKNGFKKAVLGMSGGIDSALVAAIAVDALGADDVTALTMPSEYSSAGTQQDAAVTARNLGINLVTLPISGLFRKYRQELQPHFAGLPENITEENLQARIRGNLLMAFANKFGWLVLATGNKSELSVGYCTIYGDMVGGFAVIKDVPKTMVYKLVRYYNKKRGRAVIPLSTIRRAPTAELRPNQKDEDSLPPYAVLDPILAAYIEQNKSIAEIVKTGFDRATVQKVARLVDANEYKRRQAPIGVKITPRAFGKDRRMPITNKFIV